MQKHYKILILPILLIFLLSSCLQENEHVPLKIAISKAGPGSHYDNYKKWLNIADSRLVFYNMYTMPLDSALATLAKCDGFLLTGGPDVHPAWYGQIEDTTKCGEFDLRRDSLEIKLIGGAVNMQIPILGICRGEQILNVYFGGSLVADIPTEYDTLVKHRIVEDPYSCYHRVVVDSSSKLFKTSQAGMGFVASNHHQAINRLGEELRITARADDDLPEAIEWKDPAGKAFMMAVQWHPERMDKSNPLSLPIALYFLTAATEYQGAGETK
ncbi:MAG: gamma-glutamyl-gamma-aminobutyrate hydrolase family protein [Bacteroidota bacterium]|nr:gamma-glutamyl-gamma-aminobutyrate hydrolase family protein [Bacteroidota bacterium]